MPKDQKTSTQEPQNKDLEENYQKRLENRVFEKGNLGEENWAAIHDLDKLQDLPNTLSSWLQRNQTRRLKITQKLVQKSPKKINFWIGRGEQVVHEFDP